MAASDEQRTAIFEIATEVATEIATNDTSITPELLASEEGRTGQVVVLVGASSGIGAALAVQYANKAAQKKVPFRLVLAARRVDRLEEVAARCRAKTELCHVTVIPTDVLQEAECQRLVASTVATYGQLDILIYCVGIAMHVKFINITDLSSVMNTVMGTNFTGAVYCCYAAREYLQASRGTFAVVSSVAGELSPPYLTLYAAAKHAVNGFCESLQNEEPGFHVCILCPGYVATELDDKKVVADGSIQSVELNVDRSKYMPAEEAASLIYTAVKEKKKSYHLTASGSLATTLRSLFPGAINSAVRREMQSITPS